MRIAVCDDEQELTQFSGLIRKYQSSCREDMKCNFFRNGTDFLCSLEGGEYDLIFLDVLMPGLNGIEVAEEVRKLDKTFG